MIFFRKKKLKHKCTECLQEGKKEHDGKPYCYKHYSAIIEREWGEKDVGVCPKCDHPLKNRNIKHKRITRDDNKLVWVCGLCGVILGVSDYDFASLGY